MAVERNANGQLKKGSILNPKGANQNTYQRVALEQFEKGLRRKCKRTTVSDQIIEKVLVDAVGGDPHAMKMVLERILPVIQKHQVDLPGAESITIETAPGRLDEVTEILREAETLH